MSYFALLTIAVLLNAFGYLFEITSATLDGALIAAKVTYIGSPFIGSFFYMFARDYLGRERLPSWARSALLLVPFVFLLSIILYPDINLYYQSVDYAMTDWENHLVITPGVLYYPCFAFIFTFTIWGMFLLVKGFVQEKRREGGILFVLAAVLPIAAQIAKFVGVVPGQYNPLSLSLVLSVLLMYAYLARYRRMEWESVGRNFVVQNMRDAFVVTDNRNRLLDFNLKAVEYYPDLADARVGSPISEIVGFPHNELKNAEQIEIEINVKNENRCLRFSPTPMSSRGVQTGIAFIISDQTEQRKILKELKTLARHDELTGLFNRATFFSEAKRSYDLAMRQPLMAGCALMMDIDFFKDINDTYGHAAGDEVLRMIGRLLLKRFRHTDICGRYGGEELAVWMPSTPLQAAVAVAEQVKCQIEETAVVFEGNEFSVTVSVGLVSMSTSETKHFDALINLADTALYEAKNTGRNRLVTYEEIAANQGND